MTTRNHILNRGTLFAVVAVIALVSITSLAMSSSVVIDTENESYIGTKDLGATLAEAAPGKSVKGSPARWGVFGYRSDRGLTCVQAGQVNDGKVGAYSRQGFEQFSARDSVGNCGDLTETLETMGGAAYATSAPVTPDSVDQSSVVYGLLSKDVTEVTVTVDETSERLPVEMSRASGMGVVARSFVAPLPPEASLPGVTITFELTSGKKTVSRI